MHCGAREDLYHITGECNEPISQPNASEVISHFVKQNISRLPQGNYIAKGKNMEKTIKELAVKLTVEITYICEGINGRKVFTNQLLRSCSSIGANTHEAKYAQSKADFVNKMEIALKECYETEYWLEILFKTNTIDEKTYTQLQSKCGSIRRKLIASVTTAKANKN